ncbi:uncharacterized protein LOC121866133 [Homarus americanus]|uniref:uncharacterized protein LOC121866133 n=1 Tax=Homarus americanus TaxID=6706 RepID=UPI001C4374EB|nr:uncharacterized protein LOC121866133 [Homarus americanus]
MPVNCDQWYKVVISNISVWVWWRAAPTGCGQWYWGVSGKIELWNNVDPGDKNWYYIDDQDYAVCVRWEAGYCSVTYSEATRFQPRCDDLFERPGETSLQDACINSPPSDPITYTLYAGNQYFYVHFKDPTNDHVGTRSSPYMSPSITYSQNGCT